MRWPWTRRRQIEEVSIDPAEAECFALGFLRAGGRLDVDAYVRMPPEIRSAFQRAGTRLLAETACAIARASSGPIGFAEMQQQHDPRSTGPEAIIGEALLDEAIAREFAGRPS